MGSSRDERRMFKHASDDAIKDPSIELCPQDWVGMIEMNRIFSGDPRKKIHLEECKETWRCRFIIQYTHTHRIKFRDTYAFVDEQDEKY